MNPIPVGARRIVRRVKLIPQHRTVSNSRERGLSLLMLTLLTAFIVLVTTAFHAEILHWFLIPIAISGILIGIDGMQWIRGETDLFDAASLISLLGYHFFFVAPLLMIVLDWHMKYLPDQPQDYRDWLGGMGCLNILGILAYRLVRWQMLARSPLAGKGKRHVWTINVERFWLVFSVFIVASIACQGYIFVSFGGISGLIASYTAAVAGTDMFQGSALLFAVAESLPVLLAIGFAVFMHKRRPSLPIVALVMVILTVIDFFGGGLRGSRSNVIWTLFWIAGIIHFYVRRFPRAVAYGAIFALYLFVSVYAAYKERGGNLFDSVASSGDYSAVSEGAEGPATVLVGDFSRTDDQAYLLYKRWGGAAREPAFGASYLGAATMMVPKSLWPDRPPTITKWTTELEYGTGAYDNGKMLSSRVYGIAGEAMLNFGLLGGPLAYAVFGLLVATLELFIRRLCPEDSRMMLVPFLINLFFVMLLNDSDNTLFYCIKYGLMPISLIFFASNAIPVARVSFRVVRTHLRPELT